MSFLPAAGGLIGTLVVAKVATDIASNIGKSGGKRTNTRTVSKRKIHSHKKVSRSKTFGSSKSNKSTGGSLLFSNKY